MCDVPTEEQAIMQQGLPVHCKYIHPGISCFDLGLTRFKLAFRNTMGYYLPFHLIPLLLYKRKQLRQRPIQTMSKFLSQYTKSLLFISTMVGVSRLMLCVMKNNRTIVDGWTASVPFGVAGLGLIFESEGRICEITLYIIPRFLETLANYITKRQPQLKNKGFEALIFALIIAIIHYYYQHNDKALKEVYKKSFSAFWGIN